MKNKHFAIIIWCVVAVIFVGGFWFISIKNLSSDKTDEEYDPKNNSEYRDLTAICSHDETYQEPILKTGDYYIDGNTDNDEFHIRIKDDHTYEVCGDVEKYIDSYCRYFNEDDKNADIEWYSKPRDYEIKTFHEAADFIQVRIKQHTCDGVTFSTGPTYIDEESFQNGDNIYKLVEKVSSDNDSEITASITNSES